MKKSVGYFLKFGQYSSTLSELIGNCLWLINQYRKLS